LPVNLEANSPFHKILESSVNLSPAGEIPF
jgi:hypothetical protein